jgi:hypothetical protein
VSERPFPIREIREAMALRLAEVGLSAEKREAAVSAFDRDLAGIAERWQNEDAKFYDEFERAADILDPPDEPLDTPD